MFLFLVPQCFIVSPFVDAFIAHLFKNYLNLDTTSDFLSSDSLKLLHISTMLMYGVFVPWCWFKKAPLTEPTSKKARETEDKALEEDKQWQMEEGQQHGANRRQEEENDSKTNVDQEPSHVCVSKTKSTSESI